MLGPSIGTSATTLWTACAAASSPTHFDVVAWDLPGHGHNRAVPDEQFTMAELAAGVLRVVDDVLTERGEPGGAFSYAGDSVGGSGRAAAAARRAGAGQLGRPALHRRQDRRAGPWVERSEPGPRLRDAGAGRRLGRALVRAGFLDREPARGSALLHALQDTDDVGYGQVCGALAEFDVRDRLAEIGVPVLAVAGADDAATPTDSCARSPSGVRDGRLVELDGVAHLAPAEAPGEVAAADARARSSARPRRPRPTGAPSARCVTPG